MSQRMPERLHVASRDSETLASDGRDGRALASDGRDGRALASEGNGSLSQLRRPGQPGPPGQPGQPGQAGQPRGPRQPRQRRPHTQLRQPWQHSQAAASAERGPASGRQLASRVAPVRLQVTARGALVALFALCLAACLIAAWRQFDVIAGLAYCAGCLAAPFYVRREAQLQVVLAPPLIFLLAVVFAQALTAQGNSSHGSILSVVEGTLLMLAATAPWLLAGAAGCVGVAMFRGLPDCLREFRAGFRGELKSATWHRP